jgi:hypothetical protein
MENAYLAEAGYAQIQIIMISIHKEPVQIATVLIPITAILRELTYSNIIVQEIAALLLLKNVQTENAVLEESAME